MGYNISSSVDEWLGCNWRSPLIGFLEKVFVAIIMKALMHCIGKLQVSKCYSSCPVCTLF